MLKNRLTPKLKEERDLLLEHYPKLGEGYKLKQLFKDFWEPKDKQEAEAYLAFCCDLANESRIQPFVKVANLNFKFIDLSVSLNDKLGRLF